MTFRVGMKVRLQDGRIAVIQWISSDTDRTVYYSVFAMFDETGRKLPRWAQSSYTLTEGQFTAVKPATSQPCAIPAAVMVVDVGEMASESHQNTVSSDFLAQPASVVGSGETSAVLTLDWKSQIREALLLLDEYQHAAALYGVDWVASVQGEVSS